MTKKTTFNRRGLINEIPRVKELRNLRISYYSCLANALRETADDEQIVCLTARACRQAQLPEEPCVQRTIDQERLTLSADEVRKIFRAAYTDKALKPRSAFNQKERIARGIADFFSRRYELRYNTVKKIEEWRPRDGVYREWQQLTDRDLNRMTFEQMNEGGDGWGIDLQLYLHSTMVPQYNPLTEFLDGCGRWYGHKDHIADLAHRIPTDYADWEPLFHCWFLAMVAQWLGLDSRFSNMLVPMLIGGQGTHKTTFCRMLLPPVLRDYFIDDIKMDNAEQVERVLGRMWLVNIDEYNAKTEREQAKIKRILTERDVQVRRMRSDQYVMVQRMASFIATTNERQPLNDPTGSRRYLCVEVTGLIDTVTPINYQQLYAQALYELEHGEPCFMTPGEEQLMQRHNEQFQNLSTADILLSTYYAPASRSQQNFIRAVDILADLQQHAKGSDRPNMSRLVKALKAAHYEYGARQGVRGWYARRL